MSGAEQGFPGTLCFTVSTVIPGVTLQQTQMVDAAGTGHMGLCQGRDGLLKNSGTHWVVFLVCFGFVG